MNADLLQRRELRHAMASAANALLNVSRLARGLNEQQLTVTCERTADQLGCYVGQMDDQARLAARAASPRIVR
ncbi:MAG TPA: hypothetical protein VNT99_20305 [Methylomirabilota bacterium]|nr:hypothetical protein [Methylomirabilota bacterium]